MEPLDSAAIRFEIAVGTVRQEAEHSVSDDLDRLVQDLDSHRPAEAALIGLDRPITLHVAPLFAPFDSGLPRLLEMIRTRSWERHLVLLTGQGDRVAALQLRVAEAGGAALAADPVLGGWDRWLWLMSKLDAIAAQRVVIHLAPDDLAARLAARLMVPRYGRRLYIVHQDGPPVDPLPGVTHLVEGCEARRALRARTAEVGLRIGVLSPVFRSERRISIPDLPDPPSPPGRGRRAALRWRAARAKWRIRWLRTRVQRRLARSPLAGAIWQGRVLLARIKRISGPHGPVTLSAGSEQAFSKTGALNFGKLVAEVLKATGGSHWHQGQVSAAFIDAALQALDAAGIPRDRLRFQLQAGRVLDAFSEVTPGVFIDLQATGAGLSQPAREAQWLGLPVLAAPPGGDAMTLAGQAGALMSVSMPARLSGLRARFRNLRATCDPARFARRLDAIIAVTEGRLSRRPSAPEGQALVSPLSGLMNGQGPAVMFDPTHYLGQLPPAGHTAAKDDPLAHYLAVGEALGHHPHPLFDPRLAERSMATTPGVADAVSAQPTELTRSLLGRYLVAGGVARPHQFFDPTHYLRQVPVPPDSAAMLTDFLERGQAQGLSPHPLVEPDFLTGGKSDNFPTDFALWLRGGMGFGRSSHPLFDPGAFMADGRTNQLAHAAPNMLWAHVVEGNIGGRHPHLLIWPEEVEKSRPGTLVSAVTVLELIVQNRLGTADPHPLVSTAHILSQAGWLAQAQRHPLQHFLENGAAENLDPHPWFSTQYYLYTCPDVARAGVNPLLHYLRSGAREARAPSGFFRGGSYFHRYLAFHLRLGEEHRPELLDYALRGAGLFWSSLDQDHEERRFRIDNAIAQFVQDPSDPAGTSSRLLRDALHPPTGAPHPALITEVRIVRTVTPEDGTDARNVTRFAPGEIVSVGRPAVVAVRHISAPSGRYEVPAVDAAFYPGVTVVAGNDGFITAGGVWQDHGLASFDPTTMEPKGNAAVVAVSGDRVLLRRYGGSRKIPAGIFCCGSYSKNYYHFLIETLPRAIFAARVAPPGTPVLTDDDMPDQHYQALRLVLPDNPLLRLARHRSYQVDRLWAGSMPNSFNDAFLKPDVPPDAVRTHPAILRLYADLARRLEPAGVDRTHASRRLFLRRVSHWRQLLNTEEMIKAMVQRGFKVIEPAKMAFADQIRAMAAADAVAGQSAAHFANIVFARPGAVIFPLFSNAPGSNYNLWPVLGKPLGVRVTNVVGWRVPGSTNGAAPEAHEHFNVPTHLLTSFFPGPVVACGAKECLDALLWAGAEAEVLTAAWSVTAESTPAGFEDRLIALRRVALAAITAAPEADLPGLLNHPFFADPWTTLKSGLRALGDHDATEAVAVDRVQEALTRLADPSEAPLPPGDAQRLILTAMLMLPAWKLPLIARPEDLPKAVLDNYLRWITQSPFLFRAGEDEAYVAYCARLLDWIAHQLEHGRPGRLRASVAQMATRLDMGQLFLIEAPLGPVFAARNRVLERIAVRHGTCRAVPRPADGSQGRRRIGVLFRTFDKGPDSEAVVAMFRAFPRERYEIFGYSVGFQDRVASTDAAFETEMDEAIEHRRLLSANAPQMRAQILADDLDLFVFANATTYGLQAQEMALYHRVAPVQVVTNSHLPQPLGFPSFDAYLTGVSDHPDHEINQADYSECLVRRKGPVICYMHSLKPRPSPPLDRAELGLRPEDVVMFNAGSLQKLRRECLMTMMRAVKDIPNGLLMLAPYNPGWAGRSQAFPFNRQLAETAAEVGLDPTRIKVLSELTVAEAEAALACSDIYLAPFPHGGATMMHLALIYGVPPVVLRRRSSRSIDQFLVGSLGFGDLLVDDPEEYVSHARDLATDAVRRRALSEALRKAAAAPVFVDNPTYSCDMERTLSSLLELDPAQNGSDWT